MSRQVTFRVDKKRLVSQRHSAIPGDHRRELIAPAQDTSGTWWPRGTVYQLGSSGASNPHSYQGPRGGVTPVHQTVTILSRGDGRDPRDIDGALAAVARADIDGDLPWGQDQLDAEPERE